MEEASVTNSRSLKTFWKKIFGLIAIGIILTALYCKKPVKIDEDDCYSEISNGQWVGNRWYPFRCIIDRYPTKSLFLNCVQKPEAKRHVQFIGDVNLSKYFRALVTQFTSSGDYSLPEDLENNSPVTFTKDDFIAEFFYAPTLNFHFVQCYKSLDKDYVPQVIVNMIGGFDGEPSRRTCYNFGEKLIKYQTNFIERVQEADQSMPIILMLLQDLPRNVDRTCQNLMKTAFDDFSKTNPLVRNSVVLLQLNESYPLQGLEVIVHFMCNSKSDSTCCMHTDKSYYSSTTLPFLVVCLALYMGLILVKATGTLLPLEPYLEAGKIDLDVIYIVINLVGFCVITALCVCSVERLDLFFKASPWRSPLLMFLFSIAVICVGFLKTVKLKQTSSFISKEQIAEWKGWTILLMVGLEYSNMTESMLGFWLWQFFLCCYCFVCGYSHFVWFCINNDYSLLRVVKVIVKQNYLALVVMLTIFPPIAIYALPIVNTLVFLIVYLVMYIPPRQTLTSESVTGPRSLTVPVLIKLVTAGFVIIVVTAIELYFLAPTTFNPRVHFTILYSSRMMAILGMIVGYYSVFITGNFSQAVSSKRIYGTILVFGFVVYIVFLLVAKLTYFFMISHLAVVILPIISCCILRNWSDVLKSCHSLIMKYVGVMSVEFYVLSRHILLSHNGHGLVYLFPSYFALNMFCNLFITMILVYFISYYAQQFDRKIMKSHNTEETVENTNEQQQQQQEQL